MRASSRHDLTRFPAITAAVVKLLAKYVTLDGEVVQVDAPMPRLPPPGGGVHPRTYPRIFEDGANAQRRRNRATPRRITNISVELVVLRFPRRGGPEARLP